MIHGVLKQRNRAQRLPFSAANLGYRSHVCSDNSDETRKVTCNLIQTAPHRTGSSPSPDLFQEDAMSEPTRVYTDCRQSVEQRLDTPCL